MSIALPFWGAAGGPPASLTQHPLRAFFRWGTQVGLSPSEDTSRHPARPQLCLSPPQLHPDVIWVKSTCSVRSARPCESPGFS